MEQVRCGEFGTIRQAPPILIDHPSDHMPMSPAEEQKQNTANATEVIDTNTSDNSIDSYIDNSAYRGTNPYTSKGNQRAIYPISP